MGKMIDNELAVASVRRQWDAVKQALSSGADANTRDVAGNTPLHTAVRDCNAQMVQILIQNGADVNARDNEERTPLYYAVDSEMATILITSGADVNATDNKKNTPLHWAAAGNCDVVAKLLIESGADADAKNLFRKTAAHIAADSGMWRTLEAIRESRRGSARTPQPR